MGEPSEYPARRGCVSYNYCCVPLAESFDFSLGTSKKKKKSCNSFWLDLSIIAFLASIALSEWVFMWICSPVFQRLYSKHSLLNPTQVKDQPG